MRAGGIRLQVSAGQKGTLAIHDPADKGLSICGEQKISPRPTAKIRAPPGDDALEQSFEQLLFP
jgi:hypothetical protein